MSVTASGVFICFIYQPLNSVFSIAGNSRRCSQCCTNKFIINNKYPEIKACNIFFTDNIAAIFTGCREGFFCLLNICNICCYPFSMISIYWFHNQRKSYSINSILCRFITVNYPSFWYRNFCSS